MQRDQNEHVATVMQMVDPAVAPVPNTIHDAIILNSWQRCVHQHRLDPTRMQEAIILPQTRLKEHQDRMEEFLHIARHGLETLYRQVAGMGYCVLLTDARGVTVDFLGDLVFEPSLRKAGLYLGSDWSEPLAGTCGVGTCLSTGEALTVHQGDHFDATHIPLTCTAAPVFDAQGRLNAVLDISALSSPQPKHSQHLALQLVKLFALTIENANLISRFRHQWILKLSSAPQFLDINPEYLLALDDLGHVIGYNHGVALLLKRPDPASLLGVPIQEILSLTLPELARFVPSCPSDRRAVSLMGSGHVLFMTAMPPPARPLRVNPQASERLIPEPLAQLSGGDPVLDRQIERAARLLNSPINILLTGETGTGKERFAKALHASSQRRSRPFVAVNCAAIPETLIESELFGHLPGSFSGASSKGKRGLIQEADTGTLFLDEIGDMPRDLQARLLRVLAEQEVLPIGATRPVAVNVRVIAATHCDLENRVREGRFRDDLYYRLNGAHFTLPPLRERHDLLWLMARLLREGDPGSAPPDLAPAAIQVLQAHSWPGNLRELRNALSYARAVCQGGRIECEDLPETLLGRTRIAASGALPATFPETSAGPVAGALPGTALDADGQLLMSYLRNARWNITAVSRQLGISRMTLYRRMKRLGIQSPNQRD